MTRTSALVVIACLGLPQRAEAEQATQWRTEDGGNGHRYAQVAYGGGLAYPQAKALCQSRGGHPVSITSSDEQSIVRRVMSVLTAWTGAERGASGWGWCSGEPWTFGAVCSPTPNADRIQVYGCSCCNDTFDGDIITQRVIVEWSADCNSDGIVDFGQIMQGQLPDANANGVPDRCECVASPALPACCVGNVSGDGVVDGSDLGILLGEWGP